MSSLLLNILPMEDRGLDNCTQRSEAVVGMTMDLRVAFVEEQSLLRRDILKEILKLRRS